jgi:hypothetical protein
MFVGADDRKPAPGIQPNQNVPIVVVPVFVSVKSYRYPLAPAGVDV